MRKPPRKYKAIILNNMWVQSLGSWTNMLVMMVHGC
jgi:hypothetical protein